jgi:hypothetical protein
VIGARPKKAITAIKDGVIQKIGFARILRIRSLSSSWWFYSFHPTHGSFLGFPSLFYGDGKVAKTKAAPTEALWELSLGIWLIVKGFNTSAVARLQNVSQ